MAQGQREASREPGEELTLEGCKQGASEEEKFYKRLQYVKSHSCCRMSYFLLKRGSWLKGKGLEAVSGSDVVSGQV